MRLRTLAYRCLGVCFLAMLMLGLSSAVSAGTLVVSVTTTSALDDVYPVFILCNDVPAASCNSGAPQPLIHTENEDMFPAFPSGGLDPFKNVNFSTLWSGYITYVALAPGSSSDVVIGLAPGFVTAGSPWPFLTPESQIAADVQGGSQAQQTDLVNFFLNNLSAFPQMGSQGAQVGTFWEFSNAVDVGSLSAAEAPEPSTVSFVGVAFGALIFVRRRYLMP